MTTKIADIYLRGRGPFSLPTWLGSKVGKRERDILGSRDTDSFPHKLNRDLEEYMNDDCITYFSPTKGQFTINPRTREIVG